VCLLPLALGRQVQWGITLRQGHREQRRKERYDVVQRQTIHPQHPLQRVEFCLRALVALPLQEPLQVVEHRVQGTILVVGGTAKHNPRCALADHMLTQYLHQAGFANTGLTTQEHDLPCSILTLRPALQE
jgi:hypothetical protein